MNKTHFVNMFYEPTEQAKKFYSTLEKNDTVFMNAGSLEKSKDKWVKEHVQFEKKFSDNIAYKNDRYNEFTLFYAIRHNFKFNDDDYIQFSHYRKFLNMSEEPQFKSDVYVQGSIPMLFKVNETDTVQKDIESGFRFCHIHYVWDYMETAVKEGSYVDGILWDVWKGMPMLMAPCNMFCMKWKAFKEYFDWAYPILKKVERKIDWTVPAFKNAYQHRQLAFVSERLFSFWCFMQYQIHAQNPSNGYSFSRVNVKVFDDFKPFTDAEERTMEVK